MTQKTALTLRSATLDVIQEHISASNLGPNAPHQKLSACLKDIQHKTSRYQTAPPSKKKYAYRDLQQAYAELFIAATHLANSHEVNIAQSLIEFHKKQVS